MSIFHTGIATSFLGNIAIADRGFNCQDQARMFLAEVKIPPLQKERNN